MLYGYQNHLCIFDVHLFLKGICIWYFAFACLLACMGLLLLYCIADWYVYKHYTLLLFLAGGDTRFNCRLLYVVDMRL